MRFGLCAEYDALPGLGHACGHNLIAAMSLGAALLLARVHGAAFPVSVLGTPAEEFGGGKVLMIEAGAWEGIDASLMAHPRAGEYDVACANVDMRALARFEIEVLGREAHAAADRSSGVSAGDAALLGLTALAFLRQQCPDGVILNAVLKHGGDSPNVIPGRAAVLLEVRARNGAVLDHWVERAKQCFVATSAALGAESAIRPSQPVYLEVRQDPMLASVWDDSLRAVGRDVRAVQHLGGSTDMGNVSQIVPSIHPYISILGPAVAGHSAQFAGLCTGWRAEQALLDGAICLALTAQAGRETMLLADGSMKSVT